MTTSLAEQLKKLALPESSRLEDKKKKVSLLFDGTEAAALDRDAFYDIGVDGLKSLISLEPAFESFNETLFDFPSRYLERIVESKELNKKLNREIKKFLRLLSPYLLLKHSHKALEWLICRYHIHNFNVEDLMALILPYHETKIFVKILQLIDLNMPHCSHWEWLEKVRSQGVHLPKSVLVNHAISDSSFLRFICDTTLKTISENQKYNSAKKLGTLLTFFSTTIANILCQGVNDHHITIILPAFVKGLTSDLLDFKAGGYIIAGQLVATNQVSKDVLNKLIELLLNEENVLQNERILLLLLIFQTQKPSPSIPFQSIQKWSSLIQQLVPLANEGIQMGPLVNKIVETCLQCIMKPTEDVVEAQVLCYSIVNDVLCDLENSKSLIRLIDSKYIELKNKLELKSPENLDPSLLKWMKELLDATEEKYRDIWDRDNTDDDFYKLRQKWNSPDELTLQEAGLLNLMKKCEGEHKESIWLQLRPLLLERIQNDIVFDALCAVAPFYDNLVLLLCLKRLLHPKISDPEKITLLNKIFKSRFGSNNPHIQEINNLIMRNKKHQVLDIINNYFLKQQKGSENAIEFEPWFATLHELKQFKMLGNTDLWSFGLKVLLAALPNDFNATNALQLLTALSSLERKAIKIRFDLLKSLISYLSSNKKSDIKWYDLSIRDSEIWLKIKIFEYIVEGIHKDSDNLKKYKGLLDEFSKQCFVSQGDFVRFLGAVCCGTPAEVVLNEEFNISPTLQVYAMHISWLQLKSDDKLVFNSFYPELNFVLCYLLITLNNTIPAIRKACLNVVEALANLLKKNKAKAEAVILEKIMSRSQEIFLDQNQVSVALYCSLSPSDSVQATLSEELISCLSKTRDLLIKTITDEETPLYVSLGVLQILDSVNSVPIILELFPLASKALSKSKESDVPKMILGNFWSRISETSCAVLEKEYIWELATKCIKHDKCENLCPAVTFLKQITREVFEKLSKTRKFQLVEHLVAARSETESTDIASAIASVIKKLYLDCHLILPIINQMKTLFNTTQKRRDNAKNQLYLISESKEWKYGVSLLELIQSKKKLVNSEILIQPLFEVLKFCLDQDEQTTYEYTKQLVLGCLLDCCKKFSTECGTVNENNLNVELVVQCLRASPNPQTHHHALMLLSYLSAFIPKQVMRNVMAIFTFMGTSIARMDDEHSVKVVTQVVESVVPVLVKAINTEHQDLQMVVAEILRVFVWAVKDIPQHRRKPLFSQLLNTLQPENSLWVFLLLLLENHIWQGDTSKTEGSLPTNHYLGLELCLSTSTKIVLESVVKILNYLIQIPVEKMNKEGRIVDIHIDQPKTASDGLFDIEAHTSKQLRHFCYTVLTFLNSLLADSNFIVQVGEQTTKDQKGLEEILKETIAAVMKYTPIVRKQLDKQQTKFWKAMIHQCYEIIDRFVMLVPNEMLLNVIKKLLKHSIKPLRRKALDLLNSFLQNHQEEFSDEEKNCLKKLMDPISDIINSIGKETEQQELLLQQTALLSLKFLAKLLSCDNIELFKKVLVNICHIAKSQQIEGPLLGSIMLAIAELISCLKAHSISELPTFMPLMLKIFSKNSKPKTFNELGLNTITLAIHRVVDVMPSFLSPYLDKILYNVCTVSVITRDKVDLVKKLTQIRLKLAGNVEHRVLLPAIGRCYQKIIENKEYESAEFLFSTLSSSFTSASDITKILPDVTQLFITALSFRSDCEVQIDDKVSLEHIAKVEENVIEALVPFVLKLSEPQFKPLYYQIFQWASEHPDRSITFFRLSYSLAENLKGLFVLFAGYFLQKAAHLLDLTNLSKNEKDCFGSSEREEIKSITLLENILKTLHSVFLYDSTESTNFLNKDKFEVLLHPLVDQLENTLGGIEELEKRTATLLTPCLAQMALATDDTLWKSLNYEILLKTKSILPQVRIGALETVVAIAVKLGDDYLMLLPETIGSLAELLEDEDEKVETAMKNAIQKMEDALGQPVREYFQ